MKIKVFCKSKLHPIHTPSVKKAVKAVLELEEVECDEVSIHFVGIKKISSLHEEFFQDPTPTDCISFPLDGPKTSLDYCVLGEVFICPEVAIEYSKKHSIDPKEELTLYLVHGLLHLIGYDDIDPKDRKIMRKKEKRCMHFLKRGNLLIDHKHTS